MDGARHFGDELSRLMFERKLSYRELSRRTGLSPSTLSRYVSRARRPDDPTLELLAAGLGGEPELFFEWRSRRVQEALGEHPEIVDALYRRLRTAS